MDHSIVGVKFSIAYCMFHSHLYCGFLPRMESNIILHNIYYNIYLICIQCMERIEEINAEPA